MHYKRVKHLKFENSYIYNVKFSIIKNTEKMEHNTECLLLADYHDQKKKFLSEIKDIFKKVIS
jgi:hypothetical protein